MSTDNGLHHPDTIDPATDLTLPGGRAGAIACPVCSTALDDEPGSTAVTDGRASFRLCPRCRTMVATGDDEGRRPVAAAVERGSVDPLADTAGALAWEMAEHLAAPSQTATIVDLGAGQGSLLHALDRLGYRVRGCEPSSFLCQMARATHLLGPDVLANAEPRAFVDQLHREAVTVSAFVLWHLLQDHDDPIDLIRSCLALAPAAVFFVAVPPARGPGKTGDRSSPEVRAFPTPATIVHLVEVLDLSLEAISVTRAEGLRATLRGRDPEIVDLEAVRPLTVDVEGLEASYRGLSPAFADLCPGPRLVEPDDTDNAETPSPLR